MPIRLVHGSWWIDVRWMTKRYRLRSPKNSSGGARDFEALVRTQLARLGSMEAVLAAMRGRAEPAAPTFQDFSLRWLNEYVRVNNRFSEQQHKERVIKRNLMPVFGRYPLPAITPELIEAYKRKRFDDGVKSKTINNELSCLRTCLRTANEWNLLSAVPRFRLLKYQLPAYKYLSVEEAGTLVRSLPEGVLRAMVVTALRTGLRFGEIIGLEWNDINWEQGTLCVQRSVVNGRVSGTKTFRVRHTPIHPDLRAEIETLPRINHLLFTRYGTYVGYPYASKALLRACKQAGVTQVLWHALRHTFASHLVAAGAPMTAVRDLMGHTTIEMTSRYSHLNREDLRKAVALLPNSAPSEAAMVLPLPLSGTQSPQVAL